MSEREVLIEEKTSVYEGYFRIDRYRLRHTLHGGGMGPEMVREVFERGHAAAVLPFDPIRDEVVLVEQFRIGAYAAGEDPWLAEVPAGVVEAGEVPEDVAARETLEETGLEVTALRPIARYLVSPGGTSERIDLFLGRVDAAGAGGVHGLDDEAEDIRVFSLPFAEARGLLAADRVGNAMTLIALQWLALHHDEVMSAWPGDGGASP